MPVRFLFGVMPGIDPADVAALVASLPAGASATHDLELDVLAVEVDGDARLANETLGVMSRSGLLTASLTDDAAVTKHMPHHASRPAAWDVLDDDSAICTSCSWSTMPGITIDERDRDMRRHEREIHGGRS